MNGGMISTRYARALLQYAVDQKTEDVVFSEMKKIASAFASEPKLRMAMGNPMVTADDKRNLMTAIVGKPSDTLTRFVNLVLDNKREKQLQVIAMGYQQQYCQLKNINLGKLVTATPVDDSFLEKMKTLLKTIKDGTLELETSVDPDIQGGFVLYVDTYRYDASVATQLKQIKRKFVEQSIKSV